MSLFSEPILGFLHNFQANSFIFIKQKNRFDYVASIWNFMTSCAVFPLFYFFEPTTWFWFLICEFRAERQTDTNCQSTLSFTCEHLHARYDGDLPEATEVSLDLFVMFQLTAWRLMWVPTSLHLVKALTHHCQHHLRCHHRSSHHQNHRHHLGWHHLCQRRHCI